MRLLLGFSNIIDEINEKIGVVCNWLVLLACIVSGGNAIFAGPVNSGCFVSGL